MSPAKNIIYLYSEVMPYAISVMRALVNEFGVHVDCIYWDEHKRTPFQPVDEKGVNFHPRSGFNSASIIKFISERHPSIIYISGRMDKLYLEAVLQVKDKCKIVTGSDNQWEGDTKQKVATVLSPFLYKKYFEYFWVPGRRQYEFARRIGYDNDKIIPNLLTADDNVFGSVYLRHKGIKQNKFPHNLVYAGRFAKTKGVDLLVSAFIEVKNELQNDWQLTLVGSGDMPVAGVPYIKVDEFMSGNMMAEESKNWGVFCLPSLREPWGVVIHEFTMAGLPVICSDSVGAADALVINNYNGFTFKTGNKEALKQKIKEIIAKSDAELLLMGQRGHELSNMQSPVIAAYSLMGIL